MAEWWDQFSSLMTNNAHFRAGFIWALILVAIAWALMALLNWSAVQWLKMRQFFEPIKKPGKAPVETGPSPAGILLGCVGRIVVVLLVLAIVVAGFVWFVNLPGS